MMHTHRETSKFRYKGALITVFMLLATAAVLVISPVRDYDTFWHIANGRAMAATGTIPTTELFSYTAAGKGFHNHEWLSQIILYFFYSQWDATGLIAFKVIVTIGICYLLYATCRLLGSGPVLSAILCLTAVIAALSRFSVRPQMFSILGLALIGMIFYGFRNGRFSNKTLYWLPLIVALWDCLHGALYGLVLIIAFVVAESIKPLLHQRFPSWTGSIPMSREKLRSLWFWTALTFAIALVNPYGILTYDVFVNLINGNTDAKYVGEFLPTPWQGYLPFWGLLSLTALLLLSGRKKIDPALILVFLPFAFIAIRFTRGVEAFAPVSVPILALTIGPLLESLEPKRFRLFRPAAAALVIIGLFSYIYLCKFSTPRGVDSFGTGINEDYLPAASVRFIKAVGLSGNMYNTDRYGGYISYFLAPERKIFQYNHPSIFKSFLGYLHDPKSLEQWNLNYALAGEELELKYIFSNDKWATIYREPAAAVMIRRTAQNQQLIDRYEMRVFHSQMSPAEVRRVAANPFAYPMLAREMATYLTFRHDQRVADLLAEIIMAPSSLKPEERLTMLSDAEKMNGDNAGLVAVTGLIHYLQKAYDPARSKFEHALKLKSDLPMARLNLAYLDYDTGNYQQALAEFNRFLEKSPQDTMAIYGAALSHYRLGQNQQAGELWQRYLQLDPAGQWADQARGYLAQIRQLSTGRR